MTHMRKLYLCVHTCMSSKSMRAAAYVLRKHETQIQMACPICRLPGQQPMQPLAHVGNCKGCALVHADAKQASMTVRITVWRAPCHAQQHMMLLDWSSRPKDDPGTTRHRARHVQNIGPSHNAVQRLSARKHLLSLSVGGDEQSTRNSVVDERARTQVGVREFAPQRTQRACGEAGALGCIACLPLDV